MCVYLSVEMEDFGETHSHKFLLSNTWWWRFWLLHFIRVSAWMCQRTQWMLCTEICWENVHATFMLHVMTSVIYFYLMFENRIAGASFHKLHWFLATLKLQLTTDRKTHDITTFVAFYFLQWNVSNVFLLRAPGYVLKHCRNSTQSKWTERMLLHNNIRGKMKATAANRPYELDGTCCREKTILTLKLSQIKFSAISCAREDIRCR